MSWPCNIHCPQTGHVHSSQTVTVWLQNYDELWFHSWLSCGILLLNLMPMLLLSHCVNRQLVYKFPDHCCNTPNRKSIVFWWQEFERISLLFRRGVGLPTTEVRLLRSFMARSWLVEIVSGDAVSPAPLVPWPREFPVYQRTSHRFPDMAAHSDNILTAALSKSKTWRWIYRVFWA